ncbi:MAG: 3-deoxy-D-manno-octulosonic acid kinase [bacterium]|nr:3-deoxy-D-manno-octulosonic acid kinase [bacterium]
MEPFEQIEERGWTALVRREWSASLRAALIERRGCTPLEKGGRGTVDQFEFEGGMGVLRTYRRGGLVRHFLKDSYFLSNRPLKELRVLQALHDGGLAVPEPLGAAWRTRGGWYRGLLATRRIAGENLIDALTGRKDDAERDLSEVGQLICRMHDLGAFHADLNARNIMTGPEGVYLLDFDNARLETKLSGLNRTRNLLRLRRSLEKNGFGGRPFAAICEGYGLDSLPWWLDALYALKGRASDAMSGRSGTHD